MESCLKVQNPFLNSKLNSTETHGKKDKFSPILQFPTLHGLTGVNKSAYHDQSGPITYQLEVLIV